MKIGKTLACALAAMGMATAANAAVFNGSFEDIGGQTLNARGWNHFSSVPGWTGVPNVEIQSSSTLGSIDAHDGEYYAELDTNQDAGMFQDIFLTGGSCLLYTSDAADD